MDQVPWTWRGIACQALLLLILLPAILGQTVADVVSGNGDFTVLLEAVQKAGLAAALAGPGPLTVFAPTDAAFAALLETLGVSKAELLERGDLAAILQLHLAIGRTGSSILAEGVVVQSLEGARLQSTFDEATNRVVVGEAQVVQADLNGSNGVIHGIDAVLLPPERLGLAGGAGGWDQSRWYVQVDGVMGGKSSGQAEFSDDLMLFTGTINLDGGGFSSVRKTLSTPVDLSAYAGLLVEFNSQPSADAGAPLGLHLQLGDERAYGYAAAWAIPLSMGAGRERCKVFIPLEDFDRASRAGFVCSWCKLDAAKVDSLDVYVLFQSGPFEVQLRSVSAVKRVLDAPLPTAPSVPMTADAASKLAKETIASGGQLYDKGYRELCIAIYAAAARQILAATGLSEAVRGLACAGLARAATGSKSVKAWVLRKAFDAILADVAGNPRVSESRYPGEVQGSWLPGVGDAGPPGSCAGLADLSSSAVDSTTRITAEETTRQPTTPSSDTFLGPFVGMGISGFNDLGFYSVSDPTECAKQCLKITMCKSFDYGARGQVSSECWLSTANRASAASAYTSWNLYDYYERASASEGVGSSTLGSSSTSEDLDGSTLESSSTSEDPDRTVIFSSSADDIEQFKMAEPGDDDEGSMAVFIVLGVVLLVVGIGFGSAAMLLVNRCRASKGQNRDQQGQPIPAVAMGSMHDNPTVVVVGQPVRNSKP